DRFDAVALDLVAHLDIVVAGHIEPALEALADLADILLEPLQAAQFALVDLDPVPNHADPALPVDVTLGDVAPGHGPDSRDPEELADLGDPEEDLPFLGLEQPLHRRLHVLDRLVNNVVETDIHTLAVRYVTGLGR